MSHRDLSEELEPGEPAHELFDLLRTSALSGRIISFPTIILERKDAKQAWVAPNLPARILGSRWHTSADSALVWYRYKGLLADRTRMNPEGYPGLFAKLRSPPPWVEIEPSDVLEDVSTERELDLRPLVRQIDELGASSLLTAFQAHQQAISSHLPIHEPAFAQVASLLKDEDLAEFQELLALGSAIGPRHFSELYDAVFSVPDFMGAQPGVPDLLVCHPDGVPGGWFFSEVKAHGDRLRSTQIAWLRANWPLVKGHFVLTLLE